MAPKKKSAAESTATKSKKVEGRGTRSKTETKSSAPAIQPLPRPADFKGMESLVFVDASTLKDHPDNWKTHTQRQLKALDAEFNTVGWVLPLVYNLTTGRLLDGHGRKRTDYAREKKIVPVVVGRWTPEEEDQILLHLDPIGGMFETEGGKFRALMDRHKDHLAEMSGELEQRHEEAMKHVDETLEFHQDAVDYGAPSSFLPDYTLFEEDTATSVRGSTDSRKDILNIEDSDDSLPGMYDLKLFGELPANCFGDGGLYNIPALREDMLASIPSSLQTWIGPETPEGDAYFYIYGCAAIEKVRSNKLIVAYYTYDHKFESIWNDPRKFTARMINFNVHSVITPNFSPWEGCAMWFDIYQTARSRWLGRYWQDTNKLKIIPDITLSNLLNSDRLRMRITGLPQELPAISIQVQQKGEASPEGYYAQRKVALLHFLKHIHPRQILLYHGPDLPAKWEAGIDKSIEIIPVKSWMWERGKALREKEYLSDKQ